MRSALQDGFRPGGPYVPGMGWHWMHHERLHAAAEDGPRLEEPPILVYADTDTASADDHLCLAGVEWGVPVGAQGYTEENPPDLFSDEGADAEEHWHVHESFQHLFASGDAERTDPQSLSVAQLMQRGRWAEAPPDRGVQPGDEVTADGGSPGRRRRGPSTWLRTPIRPCSRSTPGSTSRHGRTRSPTTTRTSST